MVPRATPPCPATATATAELAPTEFERRVEDDVNDDEEEAELTPPVRAALLPARPLPDAPPAATSANAKNSRVRSMPIAPARVGMRERKLRGTR